MTKYLKIFLVLIIGLILGLIIHGLIEIPALWLLTNYLSDLFFGITWSAWLWIHLVFTIIIEILGIVLAFWLYSGRCPIYRADARYKKYCKK